MNRLKTFLINEKTPLALLVLSQAYVLFLWLVGLNVYSYIAITGVFAIITAVSLDSVVVSTTFAKHRNAWSWITAIAACTSGVMIALDLFYALHWQFLHVSFPLLVFAYSNHLASEKKIASESTGTSTDSNGKFFNIDDLIDRLIDEGMVNESIYRIVKGKKQTTIELIKERRALKE